MFKKGNNKEIERENLKMAGEGGGPELGKNCEKGRSCAVPWHALSLQRLTPICSDVTANRHW
jgi:hypothetical protein